LEKVEVRTSHPGLAEFPARLLPDSLFHFPFGLLWPAAFIARVSRARLKGGTSNTEHRTPNVEEISSFSLRVLSPLVSTLPDFDLFPETG